jgi:hypothetical protein
MQSKFIRILIIINGIIIPIIALTLLYKLAEDYFERSDFSPEGVLVGEKLEGALTRNVALQGLAYDAPMNIYNSTNLYMPLSVLSYEEEKMLKEKNEQALASYRDASSFGIDSYYPMNAAYNSYENYFNVLFMDKDYKVIGKLLDRKGAISNIEIPNRYSEEKAIDTTVKNIAYYIAFEDTNKDGLLDGKDDHDLYISDLSGKNLTQVTSNIAIESWHFQKDHSQIMIIYKERNKEEKEEHKRKKFALYDIASKKLIGLDDIHKNLDVIEKQLTHQ